MQTRNFATDILTFYIKGKISQPTPDLIELQVPNSILGIIPLGKKTVSVPISQIASVGTDTGLNFKNFLVFMIALIISVAQLMSGFANGAFVHVIWALLASVVCFCGLVNSFWVMLAIINTSGEVIGFDAKNGYANGIRFVIFEKGKATAIAEEINELVAQRHSDTNFRVHAENISQSTMAGSAAIVNTINNK